MNFTEKLPIQDSDSATFLIEAFGSIYGLLKACEANKLNIVRVLLEKNVDVNARAWNNNTAIVGAVQNNHQEITKLLLERGADSNTLDANGRPILILAVENFNIDIVRLLLEKGANVNATDLTNNTALLSAVRAAVNHGKLEMTTLLLENGANLDFVDQYERTVFDYARQPNYIRMQTPPDEKSLSFNQPKYPELLKLLESYH